MLNLPGIFTMYNFFSYKFNSYVNIVSTYETALTSIDSLWGSAGYAERELMEFFGVPLLNKLDTRRLLLDYGLNTNPLLKGEGVFGTEEYVYSKYSDALVKVNSTLFNI